MTPAQKAAATRKKRAAAAKAAQTRKRRAAGVKAALTRKRKAAARKAAETRKRKAAAKQFSSLGEQPASEALPMQVERHPFTFDTQAQFPNARAFRGWEGGCAYRAERDGKSFLIIDEGTMADFLDDNDPTDREVMNRLVSVIEFDQEAELEAYIARELRFGVDLDRRRGSDD